MRQNTGRSTASRIATAGVSCRCARESADAVCEPRLPGPPSSEGGYFSVAESATIPTECVSLKIRLPSRPLQRPGAGLPATGASGQKSWAWHPMKSDGATPFVSFTFIRTRIDPWRFPDSTRDRAMTRRAPLPRRCRRDRREGHRVNLLPRFLVTPSR